MIVEEVMTSEPYVVDVTDSVGRVLEVLAEAEIRHVPVLNDGALVGMVSDRDLRELLPAPGSDWDDQETRLLLTEPISKFMSTNVLSVTPQEELSAVIDILIEQRVGAVPVTTEDSEKLLGIVSYVDILRAGRDRM